MLSKVRGAQKRSGQVDGGGPSDRIATSPSAHQCSRSSVARPRSARCVRIPPGVPPQRRSASRCRPPAAEAASVSAGRRGRVSGPRTASASWVRALQWAAPAPHTQSDGHRRRTALAVGRVRKCAEHAQRAAAEWRVGAGCDREKVEADGMRKEQTKTGNKRETEGNRCVCCSWSLIDEAS